MILGRYEPGGLRHPLSRLMEVAEEVAATVALVLDFARMSSTPPETGGRRLHTRSQGIPSTPWGVVVGVPLLTSLWPFTHNREAVTEPTGSRRRVRPVVSMALRISSTIRMPLWKMVS